MRKLIACGVALVAAVHLAVQPGDHIPQSRAVKGRRGRVHGEEKELQRYGRTLTAGEVRGQERQPRHPPGADPLEQAQSGLPQRAFFLRSVGRGPPALPYDEGQRGTLTGGIDVQDADEELE